MRQIVETRSHGRWTVTTTITPAPLGSEHVATAVATVTAPASETLVGEISATATGTLYRDPAYFSARHWYLRHVRVSCPADLPRADVEPRKDESRTRLDLVEHLVRLAADEASRVVVLRERALDVVPCGCGGGEAHRSRSNRHLDGAHFATERHVAWVLGAR